MEHNNWKSYKQDKLLKIGTEIIGGETFFALQFGIVVGAWEKDGIFFHNCLMCEPHNGNDIYKAVTYPGDEIHGVFYDSNGSEEIVRLGVIDRYADEDPDEKVVNKIKKLFEAISFEDLKKNPDEIEKFLVEFI